MKLSIKFQKYKGGLSAFFALGGPNRLFCFPFSKPNGSSNSIHRKTVLCTVSTTVDNLQLPSPETGLCKLVIGCQLSWVTFIDLAFLSPVSSFNFQ